MLEEIRRLYSLSLDLSGFVGNDFKFEISTRGEPMKVATEDRQVRMK